MRFTASTTGTRPLSKRQRIELLHSARHLGLFGFRQIVVERQPKKAVADSLSHRTLARLAAGLPAHATEMQREIMKNAQDAPRLQVRNQSLTCLCRGQNQIKHVIGLFAVRRNTGQLNVMRTCPL